MAKTNDDVIILRPGRLAEFAVEMVPCDEPLDADSSKSLRNTTADGVTETWSIDSPLEEFEDVQVPCDVSGDLPPSKQGPMSKNGKTQAVRSKPRKKPARRRKS